MKFIFSLRLLTEICAVFVAFVYAIVKRYQPLFVVIALLFLATLAFLYENISPLVLPKPLPSDYSAPQTSSLTRGQIKILQSQWEVIHQLQPDSKLVASQQAILNTQ